MSLRESLASRDEIEDYSSGGCHILAIALHRRYGWPLLAVESTEERYWEDPEDDDNYLPSILHVYAIDPDGFAWDIRGARPDTDALQDAADFFGENPADWSTDLIAREEWIQHLVGYWSEEGEEPIDRPLETYSDDDIQRADEVISRALAPILDTGAKPEDAEEVEEAPSPS
ncbi:hypothetical protein [Acetobacter persici]|uniref:Uncharacterized protein n=1 Tax=Acetobacter persici TaxID=1076596 RepID=A0A1U9LIM0_9PROT|nr:hypothetical protein [Acetobacter persici]AQT06286.1 hypothetical protein A0U91_14765 [Acetobacter persici]